jgi:hypothetical protein
MMIMTMTMVMMVVVVVVGHDCERGTAWGDQWDWGGGKERILRGEEDQSLLPIYI